jgi:predicted transcriptional regulator YdeE
MTTQKINPFSVIGIAVKTTNENGQSGIDIPALWNKFMTERVLERIPNKINNTLYCVYTDYEKDHTKPYTTVLGCKVESLESIPDGMTGKTIEGGNYILHIAKGNLLQGLVFNEWVKIWNSNIERSYTADFEVMGKKRKTPRTQKLIYL